jgi:hypothetical protein
MPVELPESYGGLIRGFSAIVIHANISSVGGRSSEMKSHPIITIIIIIILT